MFKRVGWMCSMCFVLGLLYCGQPETIKPEGVEESVVEKGGIERSTERPVSIDAKKDAGSNDKGQIDTKQPDTKQVDKALPDPGQPDPGQPDPGQPDPGQPDPGQPDPGQADRGGVESKPSPDVDRAWLGKVNCATPPPPGAVLAPAPPAYSGGTCPALQAGMNTLRSGGANRKFILVLPKNLKATERLPVIFLWHWLKSSANKFLTQGQIQDAVDQQRFIGVIPESKGDIKYFGQEFPWPFMTIVSDARLQEEVTFFDDMYSCVAKQHKINKECVASAGVSAGALFTAQLAAARSKVLSSFISLSGGTGSPGGVSNGLIRTWKSTPRKLPGLVLWGGAQDSCVLLNFELSSKTLEKSLQADGHFFVECIHNCKHSEPPVTPPAGVSKYSPIWEFAFLHPYWLKEGLSPYQVNGWPKTPISWCGIGAGSAKIRAGQCGPPACPI